MRAEKKAQQRKKRKVKRVLKILGLVLVIFIAIAGYYAYSIYNSAEKAANDMYQPLKDKSALRDKPINISKGEPFSALLLGIDHDNSKKRKNDKGRSDTMIYLTVNPKEKSIKMLSIPRDTRVKIIGHNNDAYDKINAAYAYGDEQMSIDTVENLLGVPVDFYVTMNMEGFVALIDALGGIDVVNENEFTLWGEHFAKGELHLSGKRALYYSRNRKGKNEGEWNRQDRQRQMISGIIEQALSPKFLVKYEKIFQALGKNVKTNMSFDEMKTIQSVYRPAAGKIDQLKLTEHSLRIYSPVYKNKQWYNQVDEKEIAELHDLFAKHLEWTPAK